MADDPDLAAVAETVPETVRDTVARLRAAGCVFAEDEAGLLHAQALGDAEQLEAMVRGRVAGKPLELVLGWAEFCGRRIAVDPGVFVPRRRTEFLVQRALPLLGPGDVVIDLCCGAGAVGAAVMDALHERGGIELHAADIDARAVRCAARNLADAIDGGRAFVYEGDLDAPLPAHLAGHVGVLVANVPYVPSAEIGLLPAEARDYEPLTALDGGADGLDVLRRVAQAAPRWLRPGGSVLIEISERQQDAAVAAFRMAGLEPAVHESDAYLTTVLAGRFG
jgi:release factor glutamine methyltransferase